MANWKTFKYKGHSVTIDMDKYQCIECHQYGGGGFPSVVKVKADWFESYKSKAGCQSYAGHKRESTTLAHGFDSLEEAEIWLESQLNGGDTK